METPFEYLPAVFHEIADERRAQDEKWGEQNHPVAETQIDLEFRKVKERTARDTCQRRATAGALSWYDILNEENCEVNGADTLEEQRKELIQLAAVAVAAIECIDRRLAKHQGS